MIRKCKNLEWMAERHLIPIEGGVWLDAYNKIYAKGVSGAITTRLDPSNQRFVTELYEIKSTTSHSKGLHRSATERDI